MTTLISLYGNPRHTMLVTAAGDIVYQIKTEGGVSAVNRTVPKNLEGEEQQFITTGQLNWNRPMTFQYRNDKPVPSSQFLRVPVSDNKFMKFMKMAEDHDKREFNAPTGEVYQWTLSGDTAKLRLKGSREPIATFTMEQARSLLGRDVRATLIVQEEALPLLDLVVLTWVQVALLLNTFKSKGMFASMETEWAMASAGVDSSKDY